MENKTLHIFITISLIGLLVLLSDPFMLWMPPVAATAVLLAITVLVCIFAAFVIWENGGDERDVLHRMRAGRIAYLSGVGVLTAGLIVQGLAHHIDPWISLTLMVMVLSRLVARLYSDRFQ